MMPKMDGIETLDEMKKAGLLKAGTAVIALTANAVNGAKEEYLAAGFDAYLSKPIVVSKLEEQLRRYLPPELCHVRETVGGAPADAEAPTGRTAEGDAPKDDPMEALRALGYDTDAGLIYAAGDRAFYLELVRRFAEYAEEGARTIRRDYEAKDMRDYQIRTHTLKSAARQIGANALSDMAQAQENAAKDSDWDAVRAGADALVLRYEAAGNELKAAVGAPAGAEAMPGDAVASEVGATEAVAILREALNALDDFEAEQAAALLRPLQDASAGDIALREPIEAIQAALEDFDGMTAANRINGLIDAIGEGKA